jgi:hypothetical protein
VARPAVGRAPTGAVPRVDDGCATGRKPLLGAVTRGRASPELGVRGVVS